jgi:hypothetical protein
MPTQEKVSRHPGRPPFVRSNLPSEERTPYDPGLGHYDTKVGPEPFANTLSAPTPLAATRHQMGIPGGELQEGHGTVAPTV